MPYRATEPLGALVRQHRWGGGAAMVGLAIAFGTGGLFLLLSGDSRFGGIVSLGFGALSIGNFLWTPKTSVDLHERGLVVRQGKSTRTIEWGVIESVQSTIILRHGAVHQQHHTLTVRGGDRVVLSTGVEQVGELADRIRAAVHDRLLEEAIAELRAGGEVAFGPIVAAPDALVIGGAVVPWARLALRVDGGEVWAEGAGDSVRASEVPNLFVLLDLADERAREGRDAAD